MVLLSKVYVEDGFKQMAKKTISDQAYADAIARFPVPCVDVLIIEPSKKIVYLAPRAIKPKRGWWFIGGTRQAGLTKHRAAAVNFERETKVSVAQWRFTEVAEFEYFCREREQEPQDTGCHSIAWTFTVELTPEELAIASQNLDKKEYQGEKGLQAFNWGRLVADNVDPAVWDIYDRLFPAVSAVTKKERQY